MMTQMSGNVRTSRLSKWWKWFPDQLVSTTRQTEPHKTQTCCHWCDCTEVMPWMLSLSSEISTFCRVLLLLYLTLVVFNSCQWIMIKSTLSRQLFGFITATQLRYYIYLFLEYWTLTVLTTRHSFHFLNPLDINKWEYHSSFMTKNILKTSGFIQRMQH